MRRLGPGAGERRKPSGLALGPLPCCLDLVPPDANSEERIKTQAVYWKMIPGSTGGEGETGKGEKPPKGVFISTLSLRTAGKQSAGDPLKICVELTSNIYHWVIENWSIFLPCLEPHWLRVAPRASQTPQFPVTLRASWKSLYRGCRRKILDREGGTPTAHPGWWTQAGPRQDGTRHQWLRLHLLICVS